MKRRIAQKNHMMGINYELFNTHTHTHTHTHTLHIEEFYMNKKSKTNIN